MLGPGHEIPKDDNKKGKIYYLLESTDSGELGRRKSEEAYICAKGEHVCLCGCGWMGGWMIPLRIGGRDSLIYF